MFRVELQVIIDSHLIQLELSGPRFVSVMTYSAALTKIVTEYMYSPFKTITDHSPF